MWVNRFDELNKIFDFLWFLRAKYFDQWEEYWFRFQDCLTFIHYLHVLYVAEVHLTGQEVPVGGPGHPLLHLALGVVEDGLVCSLLHRDLV